MLCLVDLISRGSSDYRAFLDHRGEPDFIQQLERTLPSLPELEMWLANRQQQEVHRLPPLPDHLHEWLQCLGKRETQDILIVESQSWTQQLTHNSTDSERRRYCQMALDWLQQGDHQDYQTRDIFPNIQVFSAHDGFSILVSQVAVLEHPQQPTFLIGAFPHPPTRDEIEKLGQDLNLFGPGANGNLLENPISLETLSRFARRAYPQEFLCEETLWLEIESQLEANLALSPEEENILRQAMPLFINGRAGSGKSMMLYYRFVECCYLYINALRHQTSEELGDCIQYRPLFLTYNPSLVEQARTKVFNLIKVNYHSILSGRLKASELDLLDHCFSTFQDVLLNCLSDDEQLLFSPNRHINFHRFKAFYSRSFARSSISAEIAWHIIRTYIKGYELTGSDSGYLDVEDYLQEVPQRDRSVSLANFQQVFNDVWPWYQKLCKENNCWDDQDLVRAALTSEGLRPIYTAIFCDEVQDFTRLELKLILHISIWKHYQLPQDIRSLPYAFAGDPMQTINPTGFRWQSLTANFFEQIVSTFNPTQRSLQQLDPYDLQNNYRSATSITLFSNIVHLWRRNLFGLTELKPQYPWRQHEMGFPPQHLTISDNLTIEDIKTIATYGMIIILPCDEGGELDFIEQDPHLKLLFEGSLQEGKKPDNIQTPASIKGMEFQKVIIYKFGDYYNRHFKDSLHCSSRKSDSLELMYFLSKLYVAVSRPLNVLGIMESLEGRDSFWDPACQLEPWLKQLGQLQSEWEPWLGQAVPARQLDAFTDVDATQYVQIAKQFLQQGWDKGSESHLRDAESYARRADDKPLLQECRAWRLRLRKNLREAGHAFVRLAQTGSELQISRLTPEREAWNCFWSGQHWHDLQHWYQRYEAEQPSHLPLAKFMVSCANEVSGEQKQPSITLILDNLPAITDWIEQVSQQHPQTLHGYRRDPSGQAFVKTLLACVEQLWSALENNKLQSQDLPEHLCSKVISVLLRLDESHNSPRHDLKRCKSLAASGYYWQHQYPQAVGIWDGIAVTEHSLYNRSRIEMDDYPQKVIWLAKENRHRTVIDAWLETKAITGRWSKFLEIVAGSLMAEAEYELLLELRIRQQSWAKLLQIPADLREAHWTIKHDLLCVDALASDQKLNSWNNFTNEQSLFFNSVLERLTEEQAWKPKLTVFNMGTVLEKQRHFHRTLTFYEDFVNHLDPNYRNHARRRWLVVKGQQISWLATSEDSEVRAKVPEYRFQQQQRAREWGVDVTTLKEGIPTLTPSGRLSNLPKTQAPIPVSTNGRAHGKEDLTLQDLQAQLELLSAEELNQVQSFLIKLRSSPKVMVKALSGSPSSTER
ncbi:MAG: hypothetical protein HC924_18330 [Synechococcaceae cyanobacterium SM2_3_2]|nr:hypothetical protein [Synechococcaceae cyanobacterium SM2_3_2]